MESSLVNNQEPVAAEKHPLRFKQVWLLLWWASNMFHLFKHVKRSFSSKTQTSLQGVPEIQKAFYSKLFSLTLSLFHLSPSWVVALQSVSSPIWRQKIGKSYHQFTSHTKKNTHTLLFQWLLGKVVVIQVGKEGLTSPVESGWAQMEKVLHGLASHGESLSSNIMGI